MTVTVWIRKSLAILASIFFTFLFCLPSADLPSGNWFDQIPLFDKWVHTGIFCTLILLWSWALRLVQLKQLRIAILLAATYGLAIEVVQHYFIPGRSFELTDLLADVIGSCIGAAIWMIYTKKIDPCRNRGRNQN